jgi:predicted dehydrogenase
MSDQTVRWGLIGCGDIARKRVAPALRDAPGRELLSVARAQSERAEAFARELGAATWHADWRDLVRDERIGAVYVATPVDLHVEQTVAAAEAGKHVLCEKPMALDLASCDRMIAACQANDVRLGVAYYRHFYPVVLRMLEILASGEIGRPVLAEALAFEWFDPPATFEGRWRLARARSGGGPMFDFGCHRLEVLLHLLGGVERASGLMANVLFAREVEDTCVAHLRFGSGACATLAVSHAAREARDTLDVYCSQGSLHVPVLNKGMLRVVAPARVREEALPPHPNLHQPLVEDFVAAVRGGCEPAVGGETGREVNRLLAAICGPSRLLVSASL